MCFPKCTKCVSDPTPLLDDEGTVIEEDYLVLPDEIHEHVDSVYLNFDFEDGILAFVYETKNGIIVVWMGPELCATLDIEII